MLTDIERAKKIYSEKGISRLAVKSIHFGYNRFIRPFLPRQEVKYNNVPVKAARLGDRYIPWRSFNRPNYEEAIIRGIQDYVSEGDHVCIVGGGWGVSTVAAAFQVTDSGRVYTFEGAKQAFEQVRETVSYNSVNEVVQINHAIVASAHSLYGADGGANVVAPRITRL
ncbi:hypothetical protein [Haladaptatus sp. GCM10025893]|uniref:hypothetical protein n=1 Tax=Haladaptatus sp. GCM10025893 TaxID=3252659 RepID=UPI0036142F3F